ncbi:hypothetical protein [Pareuzebyella sediminis]|uniref:hypothetical protein n=1 Tax=Pareuzebyella sediminis TaxID=2607998 RepID=UPI0011ED3F74|nr:hypothetical protein [Pareuzebyella sediminis]
MKKVLIALFSVLVVFIFLLYLSTSETEENFRTCTIVGMEDIEAYDFRAFDSITVAANMLYEASFIKRIMQGKQYRDVWAQPVTVPIVFLDTLKGGLHIIEEGGGMQTHSLELEDSLGIKYSLRGLSKDPQQLVPDFVREAGLENIVIDGISAQHPYAASVVAQLSNVAEILHTHPVLVFVPEQSTLGKFNEKFGNRLFYFEYESKGEIDWTGIANIKEIVDTDNLQEEKMKYGVAFQIDKQALVRARLFDLIIGDWDRHAKQWGWAIKKIPDGYSALPIAADRDNAFFKQDGVLPSLITNKITYPKIQDFDKKITSVEGLIQDFDEYFLRTATEEQFLSEAMFLRNALEDQALEKAFAVWPQDVYNLNGEEIRESIRSRRDDILHYAKEFYRLLQKRPERPIEFKGSEDLKLSENLMYCFDCHDSIPKKNPNK